MIWQHEVRAIADVETSFDIHALLHETVDLLEELIGVEHDAVANRAAHALMQDAAGDLVEDEVRVAEVHGVTGVCATLVAHDPRGAFREDVYELPFAFISPLGADYDNRAS